MFNREGLFGKREGNVRTENRGNVNVTPGLGAPAKLQPEAPPAERSQQDPPKPANKAIDDGKGSKLIVGPDIKLKGVEITDCDTLVVEGRVEASMDSRVISIAERGVFSGTVGIDLAEIRSGAASPARSSRPSSERHARAADAASPPARAGGYSVRPTPHGHWNVPLRRNVSTVETMVAIAMRITSAGTAASAHLTISTTSDQKGILMSVTTIV
jgi:hypothetical protein